MERPTEAMSAGLLGIDSWDELVDLPSGRGGATLARKDGVAYVVKAYASDDGLRGARERAALSVLSGAAGTPLLVAEANDPPCVVMTYLDGRGSLADALLGADARLAREALSSWARALAGLHAAGTLDTRVAFARELAARGPELQPRTLANDFEVAADRYAEVLDQLGLPPHREALDELRRLPSGLDDPQQEVLSPADTCPDNNVLAAGRMHLLDFEYAELRHRAWDVAYLCAPWPSCWCAWLLPDDVAEAGVAAYRQAAGTAIDDVTFIADLSLATLGWQAMTPAWFISGALASADPTEDPRRPSRRAFVLHRLGAVAGSETRPALAAMAAELRSSLHDRWGAVPLELAPAFRRSR